MTLDHLFCIGQVHERRDDVLLHELIRHTTTDREEKNAVSREEVEKDGFKRTMAIGFSVATRDFPEHPFLEVDCDAPVLVNRFLVALVVDGAIDEFEATRHHIQVELALISGPVHFWASAVDCFPKDVIVEGVKHVMDELGAMELDRGVGDGVEFEVDHGGLYSGAKGAAFILALFGFVLGASSLDSGAEELLFLDLEKVAGTGTRGRVLDELGKNCHYVPRIRCVKGALEMQRFSLLCLLFIDVALIVGALALRRLFFPQWMMLEETLFHFERGAVMLSSCVYAATISWDKHVRSVSRGAFFFFTLVAIAADTARIVYQFLIYNYGWNPRGFDIPPGQIPSHWEYAKFALLGAIWFTTALFIASGLLDADSDSTEQSKQHQDTKVRYVQMASAAQVAPMQRFAQPPNVQVNVGGQGPMRLLSAGPQWQMPPVQMAPQPIQMIAAQQPQTQTFYVDGYGGM